MNIPTISVILTSYNHEKFISQSIESVLEQTFKDFELIIIDDNSTDNSWDIITSYKDNRIIPIRHEKNVRSGVTYNAIKNIAIGKYIAIHHSDDIWMPDKLEKQVKFLEENLSYNAVFTRVEIIDETGQTFLNKNHFYYNVFEQPNRSRFEWLNYFFYYGNALCHPSVLVRKECYEDYKMFDYGYSQLPDFIKWVKICLNSEIYILNERLIKFRILNNEKNTSGNKVDSRISNSIEFYKILNEFRYIKNPKEFIEMIPEAKKYVVENEIITDFALAMECIKPNMTPMHKLFGILLLFELVNNDEKSKQISKLYNFSHMDLIEIKGRYDIFGVIPKDNYTDSKLYIDYGNGFSEENVISKKLYLNDDRIRSFDFKLKNKQNIQGIRFDPADGVFCKCKIISIKIDDKLVSIWRKNTDVSEEGFDIFFNLDPFYEIDDFLSNISEVNIEFEIEILSDIKLLKYINKNFSYSIDKEIAVARDALEKKDKEIAVARDALEKKDKEIAAARDALNKKDEEIAAARDALEKKDKEITAARYALEKKDKEIAVAQDALERKDKEIVTARDALAKKDNDIEIASNLIEKLNQDGDSVSLQINNQQKELIFLNNLLLDKNTEIENLKNINNEIQNKLNLFLNSKWNKLKKRIFKKNGG